MTRVFSLVTAVFLALLGLTLVAPAANAADTTIVKYGTTFTYHGNGSWTVKNTDNSKELKNIGPTQSVLCSNNHAGGAGDCVADASYTYTSNATNNGKNCAYIQGDRGDHGSWDTVPGDPTKSVCSDEPNVPNPDTKDVTLCHYKNGVGSRIMVTAKVWYNMYKNNSADIWEAFSYKNVDGDLINVPSQGDTTLLQYPTCKAPVHDTKITPTVSVVDKCETVNDAVTFPSNPTGYTGTVSKNGLNYTATASVVTGYIFDRAATQALGWAVNSTNTQATKSFTLTDVSCDLPNTGGKAEFNYPLAGLALLGIIGMIGVFFATRKRA